MTRPELIICPNKEALSRDAAYRFVTLAQQSVAEGRDFFVALAGGSTPALLYALLATPAFRDVIPWARVQIFFGDERAVTTDAPESNFKMAQETLLSKVPLPEDNIHRMPAEAADLDEAAEVYEHLMRAIFGPEFSTETPRFDLILLGMGPDGHCASLFPGKPALRERKRLVAVSEPGLKPFVPRLTLTYPVLNNAANVLFLIAGEDKADTLAKVLNGPYTPETFPTQAVAPAAGTLTWLVDKAAAASIEENRF